MGLRANKQMTGTDGHEERLLPLEKVQLGGHHQEPTESDRASVNSLQCRIWSSELQPRVALQPQIIDSYEHSL